MCQVITGTGKNLNDVRLADIGVVSKQIEITLGVGGKRVLAQSRLTSYIQADSKRGFECTLSLEEVAALIAKSCYYCGCSPAKGLDRMNSLRAHVVGNVVPCCEKCNIILSDLPFEAKEKLKAGLHQIQQENLLTEWEIPTKRRNTNDV